MSIKTPLQLLLERMPAPAQRLLQPSPVVFKSPAAAVEPRQQLARKAESQSQLPLWAPQLYNQKTEDFFIRHYILPDGRKAVVIVQNGIQRWFIEPLEESETTLIFTKVLFEHGWWAESTAVIRLDTSLVGYYANQGTQEADTNWVHLSGEVTGELPQTSELCDLTGQLPVITNNEHPSFYTQYQLGRFPKTTGAIGVPTGLTQLADQGLAMARRTWTSIMPEAWKSIGANMTALGVQRDPEGGCWLFMAAANLTCVRLRLPVGIICFARLLDQGQYLTPEDKRKLEAGLLGYAEPERDVNGNVVYTELLSVEEMSVAYSDGIGVYVPLAHGWQWQWQRNFEPTAGAVRVGCWFDEANNVWKSRRAEISLSWTSPVDDQPGSWAASVSAGNLGSFGQYYKSPIRVPKLPGTDSTTTVPLWPRGTPQPSPTVFYEWSTPDGYKQAQILPPEGPGSHNEQHPFYPPGGYDRWTWVACGAESNSWDWSQYSWSEKAGFNIAGAEYTYYEFDTRTDYTLSVDITPTFQHYTTSFYVEGEDVYKWWGVDSYYAGVYACDGYTEERGSKLFYTDGIKQAARIAKGEGSSEYSERSTPAPSIRGAAAVLLNTETGVVGLQGAKVSSYDMLRTQAISPDIVLEVEELLTPIENVYTPMNFTVRHNGAHAFSNNIINTGETLKTGYNIATDNSTVLQNETIGEEVWVSGAAALHSASGDVKTFDQADWFGLTSGDQDSEVPAPASYITYGGRIHWTPKFGEPELEPGYEGSMNAQPVGGI